MCKKYLQKCLFPDLKSALCTFKSPFKWSARIEGITRGPSPSSYQIGQHVCQQSSGGVLSDLVVIAAWVSLGRREREPYTKSSLPPTQRLMARPGKSQVTNTRNANLCTNANTNGDVNMMLMPAFLKTIPQIAKGFSTVVTIGLISRGKVPPRSLFAAASFSREPIPMLLSWCYAKPYGLQACPGSILFLHAMVAYIGCYTSETMSKRSRWLKCPRQKWPILPLLCPLLAPAPGGSLSKLPPSCPPCPIMMNLVPSYVQHIGQMGI